MDKNENYYKKHNVNKSQIKPSLSPEILTL